MFGIVILATLFTPLLQDAVSCHVRIAVVAIRTLNGHARGGDNYHHKEDAEEGEGNEQWFLVSISDFSCQR